MRRSLLPALAVVLIEESTYESAASAVDSETQRLRGVPLAQTDLAPTLDRIQASETDLRTSLKKVTADELGLAPSRRNDEVNNLIAQMEDRVAKSSKGGSPAELEATKKGIDNSLHSYSDEFLMPDVATSSEEIARADLATNFERLIPYSRVGGILIGRRATRGEAGVRDLGWSLQGASIRLWLTDNHSEVHQLGIFPAILVQQALLYASDKRPVVVTVMRSPLLSRRQVLLHPSLRDTPLGCRFVNDDHLIFNTLTPKGSNGEVGQELERIELQTAIYNSAVDVRKGVGSPTIGPLTPMALESLRALDVGKRDSPLTAVPEKFDQALVAQLKRCANKNADVLACINSSTTIANGGLSHRSTQVVSQIQESNFDVHDDLDFVRTDVIHPWAWPLRMAIQMSIDNENVYELSDLVPDVQTRVLKSIASEQQRDLKELQDFALLQRLFRAGYDGTLSMSFPLDRLAQLGSALKVFHPSWAQTPAWSIDGEPRNEIELEVVGIATRVKQAALMSSPERVPERNAIANTMQKCIDTLRRPMNRI